MLSSSYIIWLIVSISNDNWIATVGWAAAIVGWAGMGLLDMIKDEKTIQPEVIVRTKIRRRKKRAKQSFFHTSQ